MEEKKKKSKIFIILDIILGIIVIYFVLGFINFYMYSNNNKPLFTFKEKSYVVSDGKVDVKDYFAYKLIRHEITNNSVSYNLKLWFMKDI